MYAIDPGALNDNMPPNVEHLAMRVRSASAKLEAIAKVLTYPPQCDRLRKR